MCSDWKCAYDEPPEEGVEVETKSPGGLVQTLKRKGNLWFFPDMSMYVYYTPVMWRPIHTTSKREMR